MVSLFRAQTIYPSCDSNIQVPVGPLKTFKVATLTAVCGKMNAAVTLVTLLGFLATKLTGCDGLRDVRLLAPNYVRRGESVTLSCHYDMEQDTLYAVKWYRGNKEFYRYVPKEVPPTQVFPIYGIEVDIQGSNAYDVILRDVPFEITGKYKCVVSAEGTFQTIQDVKEVTVIAVSYGSPILSMSQDEFQPGDAVVANCSLKKTSPAANITWFIDDKPISPGEAKITTYSVPDENETTVFTTMSTMSFQLPSAFNSVIHLKCTGSMFDIYSQSSIFDIHPRRLGQSHSSVGGGWDKVLPSTSSSHPGITRRGVSQAGMEQLIFFNMTVLLLMGQLLRW